MESKKKEESKDVVLNMNDNKDEEPKAEFVEVEKPLIEDDCSLSIA